MGVGREQAGLTFARDQHDRYGDHVRVDFQGVGRTDEVVARRGRHHAASAAADRNAARALKT